MTSISVLDFKKKKTCFMNTMKLNTNGSTVKLIAHRGLSGLELENTCAAFVAAGNRETYFGIETDVHRTLDGKYVIFHDEDTKRLAVDSMIVEQTSFDTLRSLRLVDKDGTRRGDLIMPTLEEYIRICARYDKVAVLELKNEFCAADVYRIMGIVEKLGHLEHTIVISFCLKNLIRLRKRYPQVKAQLLLRTWDDRYMADLEKYNLDLDIKYLGASEELVRKLHAAGREINCWTVDSVEIAGQLMSWGVDYITTNILEGTDSYAYPL